MLIRQLALVSLLVLSTPGCALFHSAFTNPTGQITISRQEFINTYATVQVLYARLRANWTGDPDELREIDRAAKALKIKIDAKIAVPESEIDWATVEKLLGALVSLVP